MTTTTMVVMTTTAAAAAIYYTIILPSSCPCFCHRAPGVADELADAVGEGVDRQLKGEDKREEGVELPGA